ncbi:7-carboxy-7-deazaguanine synthase QueE [Thiotrichales bacterium HSG1]|nr:7-carboxy-7-deazaguanine synthase QueE [Thiotrichales bacterium HSG1]
MKYSEIFYTLQGEGRLVGVPSVFFRTSTCNLRCLWCDTAYTSWTPENKDITVSDAFNAIIKFGVKHVVITGGEPFIQKEELTILCEKLSAKGHHITIETNATIFAPVSANLISMSPKLSNSTPTSLKDKQWQKVHNRERLKLDVIRLFLDKYDCQAKFVISDIQDIQEVLELSKQLPIPKEMIVLMPQGTQINDIEERQKWLVEVCKETGYRYSPRLHINIWGDKRGT